MKKKLLSIISAGLAFAFMFSIAISAQGRNGKPTQPTGDTQSRAEKQQKLDNVRNESTQITSDLQNIR